MTQNLKDACKMCKEHHFTFQAAGNADTHFQSTQNSCSSVQRKEQEYFQHMYMVVFTKNSSHLCRNHSIRYKFLINSQKFNNVVNQLMWKLAIIWKNTFLKSKQTIQNTHNYMHFSGCHFQQWHFFICIYSGTLELGNNYFGVKKASLNDLWCTAVCALARNSLSSA